MDDIVDLLQIRIERAKSQLPEETLNAIKAIDWQAVVVGMREKKGYSFEQLGDLELETELVLCGLLSPENYQKELENRMKITKAAATELVNEMNDLVFKKIREELVKNTERKKIFANKKSTPIPAEMSASAVRENTQTPSLTNAETIPEKSEPAGEPVSNAENSAGADEAHPILAQKLSGPYQAPVITTEHTTENISKTNMPDATIIKPKIPSIDPYREIPE